MVSPLIMQLALLQLLLIAVSVMVDCTPRHWDPERLLHQQRSLSTGEDQDMPAETRHFHIEQRGSKRKGTQRAFLVIVPVRTETSNFVSIFDLRRKRFLCMDGEGALYNSRLKDREECLFQRIWLDIENSQDVFYSISGGQLLSLEAAELLVHHHKPPPSSLMQRLLGTSAKRQRRSEEVNPSDPLRSETHPPHSAPEHRLDADNKQPEQDQTGAVSKETITSCDDPLRVLQPNVPVSPVKTNIAEQADHD